MWINEYIDRHQVVEALAGVRFEWEEAADGECLVNIDGSIGLLLADLANAIGLTPDEQAQVLGVELASELCNIVFPISEIH